MTPREALMNILEHHEPGSPIAQEELIGQAATIAHCTTGVAEAWLHELAKQNTVCISEKHGFRNRFDVALKAKGCSSCSFTAHDAKGKRIAVQQPDLGKCWDLKKGRKKILESGRKR